MKAAIQSFQTQTKPEDCVLLVALPLTQLEFEEDLVDPTMDYVQNSLLKHWADQGRMPEKIASYTQDLILHAQKLGVQVYPRASLMNLSDAFRSGRRVLTLLAHWKGPKVCESDLLDLDAILQHIEEKIQQDDDPVTLALKRAATSLEIDLTSLYSERERNYKVLIDIFNQMIEHETFFIRAYQPNTHTWVFKQELQSILNREILNQWLDVKIIKPGNQVELRDGLHSPTEIQALMPNPFQIEVIDFTLCKATPLRMIVPNSVRVATAQYYRHPIIDSLMLQALYSILDQTKSHYIDVLSNIHVQYKLELNTILKDIYTDKSD